MKKSLVEKFQLPEAMQTIRDKRPDYFQHNKLTLDDISDPQDHELMIAIKNVREFRAAMKPAKKGVKKGAPRTKKQRANDECLRQKQKQRIEAERREEEKRQREVADLHPERLSSEFLIKAYGLGIGPHEVSKRFGFQYHKVYRLSHNNPDVAAAYRQSRKLRIKISSRRYYREKAAKSNQKQEEL